ncbi:uncharacterized protein EDB93DRAFT_1242442 [Suillus bovinus]|uniref:uncharacterized protein n=1 Tax=Suillus bovinus TaxID=48563 RepID=UPI001B869FD1|nr:uncharacterized protein EDB93DRAFT_1242442 [Suillus bovinus]KAG2135864.1 hypothetical protein EDB93DRAFT_1242442 [Suillus bovinus]
MSAGQINQLLNIWASTLAKYNNWPPFADHRDLYEMIDDLSFGDVRWQCFMVAYDEYSTENDQYQWKNFMSGNWAWDQADEIAKDPNMLSSTFIPIILGSDKTTVSVGMGNNEYYPLYASIGNIHNNLIYRHNTFIHSALMPACTATKEHADKPTFQNFFIYGLGPYITDYEEQVLLTCIVRGRCPKYVSIILCMAPCADPDQDLLCCCYEYMEALIEEGPLGDLWNEAGIVPELVPFTNDFLQADIYQMISPDILHQLIKDTFKDHLVKWVKKYLRNVHLRIATVTPFLGLQQFPQGHSFKQWTGNDSKAPMKNLLIQYVYLPAIEGHVHTNIVRTFLALLEFCYLICHNIITDDVLVEIEDALSCFHHYRKIFKTSGAIPTFSLPCQHLLKHYIQNI